MRYVTVEVDEVVRETDLAFLVRIDGDELWMPKSVVEGGGELDILGFQDIELEVAEWFAKKEGL